MDDNDSVCPLCCEELDISDRQFFPCKCGYQVCMWCWHRIRESESGLCPACRTPYGDDPHEFSAVDVDEVLKANKEKEAAAKKDRDRHRHQQHQAEIVHISEVETLAGGKTAGQMEVPKDRTQLANMRVIRRNLVYAVGLPPSIANEDMLRKADFFGQYGKIAKIVLNRSQMAPGIDLRRATSSAYVTFVHKEDTLACILALDGFFMDGRNIRASYGTSKYCSAFIKNVRCSNPDCTYLHQMGDIEDTFTKQEIQAGYVTSGRDVLARQQQIVQQALSAASGAAGSAPRRRIGNGGPSGTGKAALTPVFPQPTFDEPARASTVPPVPPSSVAAQGRAVSTGTGFPTISATHPIPAVPAGNMARFASTGASILDGPNNTSPTMAQLSSVVANRNSVAGPHPTNAATAPLAPAGATAASVVAGMHSFSGHSEPPAPHTTLTPLTPLKRTSLASKGQGKSSAPPAPNVPEMSKQSNVKSGAPKKSNGLKIVPQSSSANADVGSASSKTVLPARVEGVSSIGGELIAAPLATAPLSIGDPIGMPIGSQNGLRQTRSAGVGGLSEGGGDGLFGLGGEVFNGPLQSSSVKSAIGAGKDKWNVPGGGTTVYTANQTGLWGSSGAGAPIGESVPQHSDSIGGGVIGGGTFGHGGFQSTGSSALASMLGINLPSGSGSLRESTDLWMAPDAAQHAPISALNGSSFPIQGVIGGATKQTNGLIGGVTGRDGNSLQHSDPIGTGGNKSDIALLQSLLPGVHITSGGSYQGNGFGAIGGGSVNSGWNSAPGVQNYVGGASLAPGDPRQGYGLQSSFGGQPIGSIGQGHQKQRQAPGSIW